MNAPLETSNNLNEQSTNIRKIKFRAWDTIGNVMVDWLTVMQTAFNDKDFSLVYEFFTRDTLIKMQYTGLKDKNGKEVYEGDTINISRKPQNIEVLVTITFDNYCRSCSGGVGKSLYKYSLYNYSTRPDVEFEVVGNIYENPELLATA